MRILYVVLCLPEFLAYLWQIYLEKKRCIFYCYKNKELVKECKKMGNMPGVRIQKKIDVSVIFWIRQCCICHCQRREVCGN